MFIIYCAFKSKAPIWKEMTGSMYRELLRCTKTFYEICMKTLIPKSESSPATSLICFSSAIYN